MKITALYAAPLAFLFVILSMRVVAARRQAKVALGDGGDAALRRAMRAHGNCAEYVPFALVLLAVAEVGHVSIYALHAIGLMLVVGRFVHAFGISRPRENLRFRVVGMSLTYGALIAGGLADLSLVLA